MRAVFTSITAFILFLFIISSPAYAAIRYVSLAGSGLGDGSSWADASADLTAMLAASVAGDEVWVSTGTYFPSKDAFGDSSPADAHTRTFLLPDGVLLYGGFAGTETAIAQRSITANPTVLSGDLNSDDVVSLGINTLDFTYITDNVYHVLLYVGGANTTIDGFTFKGGYAGSFTSFSTATISPYAVSISHAYGGGVYIAGVGATISLLNNIFEHNRGQTGGGGAFVADGLMAVLIQKNIFFQNDGSTGGGLLIQSNNARISENVFVENVGQNYGGGFYTNKPTSQLVNNTFIANRAIIAGGGARFFLTTGVVSTCIVKNNIFWNNAIQGNATTALADIAVMATLGQTPVILRNNALQNLVGLHGNTTYEGTNRFGIPPQLFDIADPDGSDNQWRTADDGFQLNNCLSPAYNAGDGTGIVSTTDMLGNARVYSGSIDVGAYETSIPVGRVYVDAAALGANTGASWADAYPNLQMALGSVLCPSAEIWVAGGTYTPSDYPAGCTDCAIGGSDGNISTKDYTFGIAQGIKMYGGFAGTEALLSDRIAGSSPTILDGDMGGGVSVYHVATMVMDGALYAPNDSSIIDGFTFRNGAANAPTTAYITVNSIQVQRNVGGALVVEHNTSDKILVQNCQFIQNTARLDGGAVCMKRGLKVRFNRCTFDQNTSTAASGGGMACYGKTQVDNSLFTQNAASDAGALFCYHADIRALNCIFSNNTATNTGGAMSIFFGYDSLLNTVFVNNTATYGGAIYGDLWPTITVKNTTYYGNVGSSGGGAMYTQGATINIDNSIFWGNPAGMTLFTTTLTVNYTDLAGFALLGNANIYADPLFLDPADPDGADNIWRTADDGLQLLCNSPALNIGRNDSVPAFIGTDITGIARIYDGTVDMGAYERSASAPRLYVDMAAAGANNGTSWADAYTSLQTALAAVACPTAEIWVAGGLYVPSSYPRGCSDCATGGSNGIITDRLYAFGVPSGVKLYGGFAGTETALADRIVGSAPTVLSGDVYADDVVSGSGATLAIANQTDNTFHVMVACMVSGSALGITVDGFTLRGGNATPLVTNVVVNGILVSSNNGGGVFVSGGKNTFTNNIFEQNNASAGGALLSLEGKNLMANNTFRENTAAQYGGAINTIFSKDTYVNNRIENNHCSAGGGIYFGVGANRLTGNIFSNNTATYGGAVGTNPGSVSVMSDNIFYENSASGQGGAIRTSGSKDTLLNNIFTNNIAPKGGGLFLYGLGGVLRNNTIANNQATLNGGGLYVFATGNAVHNTIFWGNSLAGNATVAGADYYVESSNANTFTNCLLQLASANYPASNSLPYGIGSGASGNIFAANPLFIDAANPMGGDATWLTPDDGLRVSACSPALGQAVSGSTPNAIDGVPAYAVRDLGAYETAYENALISATLSGQAIICPSEIGTLAVNIVGGQAPYTVEYSDGTTPMTENAYLSNNQIALSVSPTLATYTLTQVTDAQGCIAPTLQGAVQSGILSTRYYVNYGVVGGNEDGTTWADAYPELRDAIGAASANRCLTEIWVAAATYKPTANSDRTQSFSLPNDLAIYGGFNATETLLVQRDIAANMTILSGGIGTASFTDNSYHVIYNSNTGANALLDGFTISRGYASVANHANGYGAAIVHNNSSPTYRNCTFSNHTAAESGAAILNAAGSRPVFENCIFSNNKALKVGGAIYNYDSSSDPTVHRCTFMQNEAANGGAIASNGTSPTVQNCIFYGNTATQKGGAWYSTANGADGSITNCTFVGNSSGTGGNAIAAVNGSAPTLLNSIVWANGGNDISGTSLIASYSIIEEGYAGTGNSTDNPLFEDIASPLGADNTWLTADDGLRLQCLSPAINAGNNTGINATDITGSARLHFMTVDMGAYETGFGSSDNAPVSANPGNLRLADAECTTADGWTHYFNTTDDAILLSLKKNGQNIGTIGDGTFQVRVGMPNNPNEPQDLSSADYIGGTGSWYVMNRTWDVVPTQQPTDSIAVRFYYQTDEFDKVNEAASYIMADETEMRFYKLIGAQAFPWSNQANLTAADVKIYLHGNTPSQKNWTRATTPDGKPYAEYFVGSFSGGGGGSGTASILSAADVQLSVITENKNALLSWISSNDGEAARYAIERGTAADALSEIGELPAVGVGEYAFTDEAVAATHAFYRIRREDKDGAVHYSNLVEVNLLDKNALSLMLFPNPTEGLLNISVAGALPEEAELVLYDAIGKEVLRRVMQPNMQLNLAEFAAGIYSYRLSANGETLASGKVAKQ